MSAVVDARLQALNDCGCCSGTSDHVVFNRPGLSTLTYRSGTWAGFKRGLLAALAERLPNTTGELALARLTARSDDDFTIALLDAVAVVADVFTFYAERIANESYLRTATERLSILELARLIGYELSPGVAARTLVVFTIEDKRSADEPPRIAQLDSGIKLQSIPGPGQKPQTFETVDDIEARPEWNEMPVAATAPETFVIDTDEIWLLGTATDLHPGDVVLLASAKRLAESGDEQWDARRVREVIPQEKAKRTRVVLGSGLGSHVPRSRPAAKPSLYVLGTRGGIFGGNAAEWRAMSPDFRANYLKYPPPGATDDHEWPGFGGIFGAVVDENTKTASVDLDAIYPDAIVGRWLVLAHPDPHNYVELYRITAAVPAGRAQFGLTGKTTWVNLEGENFQKFTSRRRDTTVYIETRELPLTDAPITPAQTGAVGSLTLATKIPDLPAGRTLFVSGIDAATGEMAGEPVILGQIDNSGPTTRLVLKSALKRSYQLFSNPEDGRSAIVYGNVAAATHGETVREVLGGGDGSRGYQTFALRQPPLTFVRDTAAASGATSTLTVWVNDLRWKEVPSFYERGGSERVFVARHDDDGRTTISFGDGTHGGRLPTGAENVRASYRKGLGEAGNIGTGQLTTLLTRPLGLKAGINPQPAVGGADPEGRDDARVSAPLTVLTLDRVVSLRDYEDFSHAYVGIAKALATWSWDGQHRTVCVTVAGPDGKTVADEVLADLAGAIVRMGDPFTPVRVVNFRPASFQVAFKLKIDPNFDPQDVPAGALVALREAFAFGQRAFGQPVALSEVMGALQNARGVGAVDVDRLERTVGGTVVNGLVKPLPAAYPETVAGVLVGAELLTLASAPIVPGVLT